MGKEHECKESKVIKDSSIERHIRISDEGECELLLSNENVSIASPITFCPYCGKNLKEEAINPEELSPKTKPLKSEMSEEELSDSIMKSNLNWLNKLKNLK